jgi:hypothetical protein
MCFSSVVNRGWQTEDKLLEGDAGAGAPGECGMNARAPFCVPNGSHATPV